MGPSHAREQSLAHDDVEALLREKDDQIAALEARLEAYGARASTAHTRLLKTIDVLDALRSQHALEMSAEEQARIKLVHEVTRLRTVAQNLEVEKDELKDVVEDLIEKVGCTSLNMQQGNLNVEFAEQVATSAIDDGATKENHNSDLLAYATSIIARLRMELDFERQRHSKSVEEANLRIEELEAKVAVREAELENRVTSLGDQEHRLEPLDVSTHDAKKRNSSKTLSEPKPLSDEECLRFLESNNARNRSLEIEIRRITEKLEQARMATSTASGSREEPQPPTTRNGAKVMPTSSSRTRSASAGSNAPPRPLGDDGVASTSGIASPSTMVSIVQLDNQIHAMSTHMDALVSERTTLIETAARQRRVTESVSVDAFQDVLRVETECVRLRAEVDDLREQLQHARTFARNREMALLREIAQFRASPSGATALHPAPDLYHIFSPKPMEDAIESMELASPLLPTQFPTPACRDTITEADLVSFSFSPNHASSPVGAPGTPSTLPHSPGSQDIERVRAALDAARTHLAQKEEAFAQLRAEMEMLQLELQAQTRTNADRIGDEG